MFMFREFQSQTYLPPDVATVFKYEWLALHEAVFMLTQWPKTGLLPSIIENVPEDISKVRSYFYVPTKPFDPNKYGKSFSDVFLQMKSSIENDWLSARFAPIFNGVCHLVKPHDVLFWALSRGMMLSEELQNACKVYLFEPKGKKSALERKVKNKIIAQFILAKKQNATNAEIIAHPLMKYCGTVGNTVISRHKMVEKHINELKENGSDYIFEPIPEIFRKNLQKTEYNMRWLIRAMVTAAMIKVFQMKERNEIHKTFEHFVDDFFTDPIVGIYLDSAPEVVRRVVFEKVAYCAPDTE